MPKNQDAIALLKQDHREVEALFKRFERAGDSATKEKKSIAQQVVKALSIHATIEEAFFYPAVRELSPKLDDQVLEALEEHHVAKWTLDELDKMSPEDERFDAKFTVLSENIRHHVKEEESELFPNVRKQMTREQLLALGEAMAQGKKVAPTHPHPMSPDTPPGNLISATLAKILDSAKDLVAKTGKQAQRRVERGIRDAKKSLRGAARKRANG